MTLESWTRLEPVPRDPTLVEGLQARTADPLWMLARQQAFGEFQAEDAASPIGVRMRARVSGLTRVKLGSQPPAKLPAPDVPLETLVEAAGASAVRATPLDAAQAGVHYLRLLSRTPSVGDLSTYRQGLLSAYPFPAAPASGSSSAAGPPAPDPKSPTLRAYTGRVPDGGALYAAFKQAGVGSGGTLPATPPLGAAAPDAVLAVAREWYAWYESVIIEGSAVPSAWDPHRLEHALTVAAPGPDHERMLTASEYSSGSLDWQDFDIAPPGTTLGAGAADLPGAEQTVIYNALPTPVRYRGMPSPRFWAFEDAAVDFGAITAPVEEITTSLIVEFALLYANDHFIVPFPLDIGSVCQIDHLIVTNTFGETILVRPITSVEDHTGQFRLFEHTSIGSTARDPLFALLPTLDNIMSGTPVEEVHYLRDEIADVVWGVERTANGPDGLPVDRTAAELTRRTSPATRPAPDPAQLRYLLRTDVPGNWFPFLPPDSGAVSILTPSTVPPLNGSPASVPWGQLITEQSIGLAPEEVTRTGLQATRAWRYARWIDGRQLAWIGRRTRPGRGPGASGLRFDLAVPQPQRTTP